MLKTLTETPQPRTSEPAHTLKPWRQILAENRREMPKPADEQPDKPPQQETVLPDGSLSEQRRAELAALSSRVCDVALGGGG